MIRTKWLMAMVAALASSACTTIEVARVDAKAHPIDLMCIEVNTEVQVDDLLTVLERDLQRRGMRTKVYTGAQAPADCIYSVWYQAWRGWDVAPYVRRVELRLRRGGETFNTAVYNHAGGLALNKWAGTEAKLRPLLDELFAAFPRRVAG